MRLQNPWCAARTPAARWVPPAPPPDFCGRRDVRRTRAWAICALLRPSAASSAIRRSLAVSASSPVSRVRRGLPQLLTCLCSAIAAPQERTQIRLGARSFEAGVGAVEHRDRLAQQPLALAGVRRQPGDTKRHTDGAGRPEGTGQLQLLRAQLPRGLDVAERELRQRGAGAPVHVGPRSSRGRRGWS